MENLTDIAWFAAELATLTAAYLLLLKIAGR